MINPLKNLFTAIEWTWSDASSREFDVEEDGRCVVFHPRGRTGPAAVRGSVALGVGLHYWEIKVISLIYGSDMVLPVSI